MPKGVGDFLLFQKLRNGFPHFLRLLIYDEVPAF